MSDVLNSCKKKVNRMTQPVQRFFQRPILGRVVCLLLIGALVIISNLYLQWCQNNLSTSLPLKFAFDWHTEKFFLGCFVLLVFFCFIYGVAGSWLTATLFYSVLIGLLGFADYQKMLYRLEPIYPDDLKMIVEFGLLREMIGTGLFILALLAIILALGCLLYSIYRSLFLPKRKQIKRVSFLIISALMLVYISDFNDENNLLRKAYNRTALWIPYRQKMNYYNTGFMGGFLYNLKVEAMDKPADYSEAKVKEIVTKYQKQAKAINAERSVDETPNIIYIMSESFSDPLRLNGFKPIADPLAAYRQVANQTYSGQMLSQNYGGGTANIEFEALTSLSMEPLNAQMTTPYTMLVPKLSKIPNLVSLLNNRGYTTTAIHPYNTSMYKRKDVYEKLGFQNFLYEDTMTHTDKIEDNPYISDEAAYEEIMDLLANDENPQFVHLVTMQTHMPYGNKYTDFDYSLASGTGSADIVSYMQDISYSSEALKSFLKGLENLDRRTLVVFWGDHLPGIYSDAIKAENTELNLHETEFLMYDSAQDASFKHVSGETVTSPVYFAPELLDKSAMLSTGYYQLVLQMNEVLPAFEKNFYQATDNSWSSTLLLTDEQQEIYDDYAMIEYDIVSGKQYSLDLAFFDTAK